MAPSPSSFCLLRFFPLSVFLVPFCSPLYTPLNCSLSPADWGTVHPGLHPLRAVAPRAFLSIFLIFFKTNTRGLSSPSPSALSSSPCGPLFHSVFGPYSPLPCRKLYSFSDSSILPISESQSLAP